jgi:hypothetical protein
MLGMERELTPEMGMEPSVCTLGELVQTRVPMLGMERELTPEMGMEPVCVLCRVV